MKNLTPPVKLQLPDNEPSVDYILSVSVNFKEEEDFNEVSFLIGFHFCT